jgi:hypothetical protein
MNQYFPGLLLAVGSMLVACNGTPSVDHQPITGNHPVSPDTVAGLDTTAAAGAAMPFVTPTPSGRVLRTTSPSPPASRNQ